MSVHHKITQSTAYGTTADMRSTIDHDRRQAAGEMVMVVGNSHWSTTDNVWFEEANNISDAMLEIGSSHYGSIEPGTTIISGGQSFTVTSAHYGPPEGANRHERRKWYSRKRRGLDT